MSYISSWLRRREVRALSDTLQGVGTVSWPAHLILRHRRTRGRYSRYYSMLSQHVKGTQGNRRSQQCQSSRLQSSAVKRQNGTAEPLSLNTRSVNSSRMCGNHCLEKKCQQVHTYVGYIEDSQQFVLRNQLDKINNFPLKYILSFSIYSEVEHQFRVLVEYLL